MTMNNLVRSVQFTGRLGVVGLFIPHATSMPATRAPLRWSSSPELQ
jgi:hypothetical protein